MHLIALLFMLAAGWEQKNFDCQKPDHCDDEKCCTTGLAVFTREQEGSDVREVKAVGQIDAPPEKVFALVSDYEHQVGTMPYLEDTKVFARDEDSVLFWAVGNFPFVSKRDWVVRAKLERNLPGGVFRASWSPAETPQAPPPADHVVRLKINTGSWTLEPIDGGARTLATYQILTDPGGSIPKFIANKANTTALPELFSRVRKKLEK